MTKRQSDKDSVMVHAAFVSVATEALEAIRFVLQDAERTIELVKGEAPKRWLDRLMRVELLAREKSALLSAPLPELQPTYTDILQAVARGWCSTENERKEMDAALATAIADEVWQAIGGFKPLSASGTINNFYRDKEGSALVDMYPTDTTAKP